MNRDVFVVCDTSFYEADRYHREMLGKARTLLQMNERVVAVVFGKMDIAKHRQLYLYGAQKIILIDVSIPLQPYATAKMIARLAEQEQPGLILFSDTDKMKLIAAQTATHIGSGLTADCIDIKRHDARFIFSRAALSSSVIAEIMCTNCDMQLCTVKKGVFSSYVDDTYEAIVSDDDTYQKFDCCDIEVNEWLIKPINSYLCQQEDNGLDDASIIFAIGRGVDAEDIDHVKAIAKRFKAAVGCTRIMVENGYFDKTKQIGQSGYNVSPKLYIAIGISGASQHIVGMHKSKTVIAVNHDPDAPIMRYADYGIIREAKEIINSLQIITQERVTTV